MNDAAIAHRVHVAISPLQSADPAIVKAMAQITGKTAYDLRLKLKGDVPKSLLTCGSIAEAEAVALRLNELGLTTLVYREVDLPPQLPFPAFRLAKGGSLLRLTDRPGNERTLDARDVMLIVYGRRIIQSTHSELKSVRKFSMGGAAITGMPTTRVHTEVEKHREVACEHFCLVFPFDVNEPAVEFSERGVDYACLGRFMQRTKPANHRILVGQLRKLLAGVPCDERLLAGQSGNQGEGFYNRKRAPDSSWAYATLIYWEMLAARSERKHFTAPDGEPEAQRASRREQPDADSVE